MLTCTLTKATATATWSTSAKGMDSWVATHATSTPAGPKATQAPSKELLKDPLRLILIEGIPGPAAAAAPATASSKPCATSQSIVSRRTTSLSIDLPQSLPGVQQALHGRHNWRHASEIYAHLESLLRLHLHLEGVPPSSDPPPHICRIFPSSACLTRHRRPPQLPNNIFAFVQLHV